MRDKPFTRCRVCKKLHQDGGSYCSEHRHKVVRPQERERGKTKERGYGGNWRKVRDSKLSENPLCEFCLEEGKIVPAQLVHHKDHNQFNNEKSNLQSACRAHHEAHHGRKRGPIGNQLHRQRGQTPQA